VLFMGKCVLTALFVKEWARVAKSHCQDSEIITSVSNQERDSENALKELLGVIMTEVDDDFHTKLIKFGERQASKRNNWKKEEDYISSNTTPNAFGVPGFSPPLFSPAGSAFNEGVGLVDGLAILYNLVVAKAKVIRGEGAEQAVVDDERPARTRNDSKTKRQRVNGKSICFNLHHATREDLTTSQNLPEQS
jgi:hypothetical protein